MKILKINEHIFGRKLLNNLTRYVTYFENLLFSLKHNLIRYLFTSLFDLC